MDHVRLGNTGLLVSKLCLGTMTFGLQCDETTSAAIMDRAAEGGITFIDTADVYPLGGGLPTVGRTEEIVGDWLRGKRDKFVVATKCVGRTGPAPWDQGNSRKHILAAVEAFAAATGDRLHRPLPTARARPGHPDRRDAGRARRPRPLGQGPLRRLLQLPGLPAGAGARPERGALPGALRLGAAPLQPAVPPDRARAAPALRRRGPGGHPLQPDRRRPAVGQARPVVVARPRAPASRWATRPATTRTATGTTASSPRWRSCAKSPNARGSRSSPSPWPGSWPTRR